MSLAAPAGIVLAAGEGTRLRPLTDLRPKALCPVGGRSLVDLALDRLTPAAGSGADHLAVNAHHHVEQVLAHFRAGPHRARVQVEIGEALGTAGAIGALVPWLDGRDALVTNADSYLPGGLAGFTDGWDGERCRLLCRPVPASAPGPAGSGDTHPASAAPTAPTALTALTALTARAAQTAQTARAARAARADFVAPDGTGLGYVGVCLLPWHRIRDLAATPSGLYELLWHDDVRTGSLDLVQLPADAVAIDCGTPADYLAANLHASGGRSVIGAGATVLGRLERSVVWDGAWVGPQEHLVDQIRAGDRRNPLTVGLF